MFEKALFESTHRTAPRGRLLLLLTVAVLAHGIALVVFTAAQVWAVEPVPDVYLIKRLPPTDPGPKPPGPTGGRVALVVQPRVIPDAIPTPEPTETPRVRAELTPRAEADMPTTLTDEMEPPRRIGGPGPVYPEAARKARREGLVILEMIVERDGTVGALRVLRDGVGFGAGEAALATVQQWRYQPARLNDRPVAVIMTVTVSFRLT